MADSPLQIQEGQRGGPLAARESAFTHALAAALGEAAVTRCAPLAPYTTFRTGGDADWLVEVKTTDALARVLALATQWQVPVTMLGGGSNVLVGDAGVRGLVVRARLMEMSHVSSTCVQAQAGVTINGLVRWTIARGLGGLEAWAGTPGTVGGAIRGNAHFQGRLLGECLSAVHVLSPSGEPRRLSVDEMAFGYDRSRLQFSGEVLTAADFRVEPGEPTALRAVARESLAFRKRTQPLHLASAGCIFQNPTADDPVPDGMPRSAGALIDRAGLKGRRIGRACVSPVHANFIVNEGQASANDIRRLIELCRVEVMRQFGVRLREEIVYLGTFAAPSVDTP